MVEYIMPVRWLTPSQLREMCNSNPEEVMGMAGKKKANAKKKKAVKK